MCAILFLLFVIQNRIFGGGRLTTLVGIVFIPSVFFRKISNALGFVITFYFVTLFVFSTLRLEWRVLSDGSQKQLVTFSVKRR